MMTAGAILSGRGGAGVGEVGRLSGVLRGLWEVKDSCPVQLGFDDVLYWDTGERGRCLDLHRLWHPVSRGAVVLLVIIANRPLYHLWV